MRNILNSRSMSFDLSKENRINFDLYDMRQSFIFFLSHVVCFVFIIGFPFMEIVGIVYVIAYMCL